MNAHSFGYRVVFAFKTLVIALLLMVGSAGRAQSVPTVERITRIEPRVDKPDHYHTLTMGCPYPDGAAVSVVLATYRPEILKPLNSLKNCLEPRPTRWTALI